MPTDAEAIAALVYRYATLLDAGDLDGVAALFAHATWRSPARADPLRGAAAVRRVYDDVILYDDGTPRTQHVVSNLTIEVRGAAATARSYFTVLQATAGVRLQPIVAGRYEDAFDRVAGAWRFADRRIVPTLIGDLRHHLRGARGR